MIDRSSDEPAREVGEVRMQSRGGEPGVTGPPATTGDEEMRDAMANAGRSVERALARIHDGTSAGAVFSPAERIGDKLVITAAEVKRAGGFGFGAGLGTDDPSERGAGGGGAGGGGQSDARPVAVITVGPDGVSVKPVLDYTKIGLAVLAGALTLWRLTRKRRR